jgi:hypothetical protein
MTVLDDEWLSIYPTPEFIGYDNGKEYKRVFKEKVRTYYVV